MKSNRHIKHKWIIIFCLVFAGEMIFSLPFHIARFFRPTMLAAFQLSNTELGDAIAFYGIMAMLSYFPGGVLADRFSARNLMSVSLAATAGGGLYLLTFPGLMGLAIVFGYWGVTTILFFWAAMIKATREWGGRLAQGRAFGFLDGGRGLIAAGAATVAVLMFSRMLPVEVETTAVAQQRFALQTVILYYTLLTLLAALAVRFFIPDNKPEEAIIERHPLEGVREVLRSRSVWLQAIIVVAAYCGYKGLDFYSLYGIESLGMNEVASAEFVSYASYLRAVGAIGAGFLVDRYSASKIIAFTFTLLIISYLVLVFVKPVGVWVGFIIGNLIVSFLAVFALRGVYFALLEESKIKKALTGTAVGIISVIGYTPDVFFNAAVGRILDASPGLEGFSHFFLFLAGLGFTGLMASLALLFRNRA